MVDGGPIALAHWFSQGLIPSYERARSKLKDVGGGEGATSETAESAREDFEMEVRVTAPSEVPALTCLSPF